MNPVVLLAVPDDQERVAKLRAALVKHGCNVVFDRTMPDSQNWPKAVKRAMAAPGVMLFWSNAAPGAGAATYDKLARRAVDENKAICVGLDARAVPAALGTGGVYDMSGWRSRLPGLALLDLADAVKAREQRDDLPKPSSALKLFRRWLGAIGIMALMGGLVTLITLCGYVPNPPEEMAWRALRPGSCTGLKAFRENFPNGNHKGEADVLWSQRVATDAERWVIRDVPVEFSVNSAAENGAPNRETALRAALARAAAQVERRCRGDALIGSSRYLSKSLEPQPPSCERFASGYVCNVAGGGLCRIQVRELEPRETCAAPR